MKFRLNFTATIDREVSDGARTLKVVPVSAGDANFCCMYRKGCHVSGPPKQFGTSRVERFQLRDKQPGHRGAFERRGRLRDLGSKDRVKKAQRGPGKFGPRRESLLESARGPT
jgi:hypothetical protein